MADAIGIPLFILYFLIAIFLSSPCIDASQRWFPVLEAVASGQIELPSDKAGAAVGVFAALDSPNRVPGTIFTKEAYHKSHQEQGSPPPKQKTETNDVQHGVNGLSESREGKISIRDSDLSEVEQRLVQLRQQAIQDPANASVHAMLGTMAQLLDLKVHSGGPLAREARVHYEKALQLGFSGDLETLYMNLGMLYGWMGDLDPAVETFGKLLAIPTLSREKQAEAHLHRAEAFENSGRFTEACADYRRVMVLAPEECSAWTGLMQILKDQPYAESISGVDWRAMARDVQLAFEQVTAPAARARFQFALFTANEKAKDYQTAWRHLVAANRFYFDEAVSKHGYYEAKKVSQLQMTQMTSAFRRGSWPEGIGSTSSAPVFIVGTMRSGSTLLEQILSSHSKVFGAGEDSVFSTKVGETINSIMDSIRSQDMQRFSQAVHEAALAVVQGMYEKVPSEERATVERIVDKQLFNFKYLGLVHLLFPRATIIHSTRSFMDVIFSSYKHYFNEPSLEWSFDLAETVEYYLIYRKVMDHWLQSLPDGTVHSIEYEALVNDQEGVSRELVAHVGLDWEDSLLTFHETKRAVHTMSSAQVRQPISSSGLQTWRPYALQLAPLMREIDAKLGVTVQLGEGALAELYVLEEEQQRTWTQHSSSHDLRSVEFQATGEASTSDIEEEDDVEFI